MSSWHDVDCRKYTKHAMYNLCCRNIRSLIGIDLFKLSSWYLFGLFSFIELLELFNGQLSDLDGINRVHSMPRGILLWFFGTVSSL